MVNMKISQVQIAIIFTLDKDVVFTVADSLKRLQRQYNGNIQMLNNIPDATPPNAPRIIFNCPNFVLNISLMRFDIFINPPEHICAESEKVFTYLKSLVKSINDSFVVNTVKYEWSGLVLTIEVPKSTQKNTRAIQFFDPIFDKLINIKRDGRDLASFSLQFGVLDDPYFINYSIAGYEKLNIPIQNLIQAQPGVKTINPEIVESGITVTLDINNQPEKNKKTFNDDITSILLKASEKFGSVSEDTGLKDFI
jgi:hypothetical protein